MKNFDIYLPEIGYSFPMVFVKGTGQTTYLFGENDTADIHVNDFVISTFQVTQRLWKYIMGTNPSHFEGEDRPVENVSFNDITKENGFLHKLNIAFGDNYKLVFRLPSETEWEYAARGGIHWADRFQFSGSHNIHDVAWYELNSGKYQDPEIIKKLKNHEKGTETHPVAQKHPNQLGLFDMSGNVWEWCHDFYQTDIHSIPKDGTPCSEDNNERVLRGGCHHNWAIHCTVSKRYAIIPEAKDECTTKVLLLKPTVLINFTGRFYKNVFP